jgi:hypothetical protein
MAYQTLRYNEVRQKSIHNAFQRLEGLYDQVVFWGGRSLELDLHRSAGDWKIYHFLLDPQTSVERLSDALKIFWGMNNVLPNHEVITVFLDIKDPFNVKNSPRRLDALIRDHLAGAVYTPRHLARRAKSQVNLQGVVHAARWPLLNDLRGRFVFVLTGPMTQLNQYDQGPHSPSGPVAFIAPELKKVRDTARFPGAVFFNLNGAAARRELGPKLFAQGFVSRSYYLDSAFRWRHALRYQIHHMATDKVNEERDPWSFTRNPKGWPFQSISGPTPRIGPPDSVHGIDVRSRDIWGKEDSGFFRYRWFKTRNPDRMYEVFAASPNSHVQDWAKCGLMARTSLAADAAYFAVLRIAERHQLRAQFRLTSGAGTEETVKPVRGTVRVDSEDLGHIRLEISNGGRRARAWGSATGRSNQWKLIESRCFAEPLRYHGFWGSSHDPQSAIRFVFATPRGAPTFNRDCAIGKSAHGRYFKDRIPRASPKP